MLRVLVDACRPPLRGSYIQIGPESLVVPLRKVETALLVLRALLRGEASGVFAADSFHVSNSDFLPSLFAAKDSVLV